MLTQYVFTLEIIRCKWEIMMDNSWPQRQAQLMNHSYLLVSTSLPTVIRSVKHIALIL